MVVNKGCYVANVVVYNDPTVVGGIVLKNFTAIERFH